jgi:hypothetical protein
MQKMMMYIFHQTVKVQLFIQSELNYLICNLDLTKENSKLLGSRLKQKSLLAPGTTIYWYRNRKEEFKQFFIKEDELVVCCDIPG